MKWIVCGKSEAGVECLEHLVARGDVVWAIASHTDRARHGWQRSFAAFAQQMGVRLDQPPNINHVDFIERLRDFRADALLSVQYDQILRAKLLRTIGTSCLNFHFSLLPRHRGVAPIAWAIASGDTESGVTLHHMTPATDAGDIIEQRRVPILPTQDARQLYMSVSSACTALLRESYPFDRSFLGRRRPQDVDEAVYHRAGDFDFGARRIVWSQRAVVLQRWIRAMIFPPLQLPELVYQGVMLGVTAVGESIGAPTGKLAGTIVAHHSDGIEVATGDGTIRLCGLDALEPPAIARVSRRWLRELEIGTVLR